jgi:hypothetical protein
MTVFHISGAISRDADNSRLSRLFGQFGCFCSKQDSHLPDDFASARKGHGHLMAGNVLVVKHAGWRLSCAARQKRLAPSFS